MKEQPYPAISISAIAKKAGISRMGFYRNYDSKDAVLRDY
ncbi:TetR/AcrR family transcriptional regulator [Secundilactobacillus paracollinoides]|nr:TetR/AcrR family transcriptional regulator [Secundilactobacillus paracollinoides]